MLCFCGGVRYFHSVGYIQDLFHPSLRGLYIGAGLLFLVTLCDELGRIVSPKLRVSSMMRLGVQIIAGGLAYIVSDVGVFSLPLPGFEDISL
jgi:hypothetical protein